MELLKVDNLKTYFYNSGGIVKAVDGVSFGINKGEVFGIIGQSGSGKTLTALSILRLVTPPAKIAGGSILFNGKNLLKIPEEEIRHVRGSGISMVFQEPSSALNPVFTIGYQLLESVLAHRQVKSSAAKDIAMQALTKVHIKDPAKVFCDYPHQLSGGTKQRIMIAMSIINSPELLVLDEPTTALDVTIQSQILDLLEEIIEKEKLSILFISHDFGVIARMCDHVSVMHKGKIIESGLKDRVLKNPKEPYTASLIESVKALS